MSIVVLEYHYLDYLFYSRIPGLNQLRDSAQATGNFRAVSNASKYGTTTILKICQLIVMRFLSIFTIPKRWEAQPQ